MDFNVLVDRKGTGAIKWDGQGEDVIPLWVADMDFPSPPQVAEALKARVDHGIYGYTDPGPGFFAALADWYRLRYGVDLEPGEFLLGPGAVVSLALAARIFASEGDGVLIFPPVYHPFRQVIRENGRRVINAPLNLDPSGRFSFNPGALEEAAARAKDDGIRTPVLFFCSPHNPSGTVWRREEIQALLAAAKRHSMIVIADEIHGDFVRPGVRFLSMAGFPGYEDRVVVISSANKTFNLAGLPLSHFVVRDGELRARISAGLSAAGFSQPNVFSLIAAEAAFRHGGAWLDELAAYLTGNIDYSVETVNAAGAGIHAYRCEGTYLLWADVSELVNRKNLPDDAVLAARLEAEARVKATPGSLFGPGGRGFLRINAACPRPQLAEGLRRIVAWARD